MNSTLQKAALPVVVVGIALAGAAYMMANRVTPERAEVEEVSTPVEVLEASVRSEQIIISAQGTVAPALEVRIRPEVSGRIVKRSAALVPGGRFRRGETMVRIDERDYRVNLTRQREAVATAELVLRQERARKAVAEDEWELLEDSVPADAENRDLALRIPQIEQAQAVVAAARGSLTKAELDLERCTIRAPFNALVVRESADLGQVVNPQTEVATLVGTDAYWVQVALPVEDLVWIDIPHEGRRRGSKATIRHRSGDLEVVREGYVERLLGDVDQAGRLARLLVVIEDPLHLKTGQTDRGVPLLLGAYVTVEIEGRRVDDVFAVPRRALREINPASASSVREGLWVMDESRRLEIRPTEVVWRAEQTVLVRSGVEAGELVVISDISTPIRGMMLEIADEADGGQS